VRFTRVTLFFIAFIIALGFYLLATRFVTEVEPQVFQATEEVMVDVAEVLAAVVSDELAGRGPGAAPDAGALREAFNAAHQRKFEALIYQHLKTRVGIDVYLTDKHGRVLFDSDGGKREGQDYAQKRDVALTLQGRYGARASRDIAGDPDSSVMYVGAPVGDPRNPLGVLTVFKAKDEVLPLVAERRRIIYVACALIGGGIMILIAVVFLWLFRPIGNITEYARAIERGERPPKPRIGIGREVNTLARALDSMRDVLEGRKYAERYIQTLTHEMKSPLAAIRGAAELLDEDMPRETRQRFIDNIRAESARTERLINRLLELSAIERRTALDGCQTIDLRDSVRRALDQARPLAEVSNISLTTEMPNTAVALDGDAFILRAAVTNLLENAIDFSPPGAAVAITLAVVDGCAELRISDQGPGIPEYARARVFERFFSLRHHSAGRKGTGLGLTLVSEAADLHGGSITLVPAEPAGTIAILRLPLAS
jgi:two-component system sensor histidine kinase CreC